MRRLRLFIRLLPDKVLVDIWGAVSEVWENREEFIRDDGEEAFEDFELDEHQRLEVIMGAFHKEAGRRGMLNEHQGLKEEYIR